MARSWITPKTNWTKSDKFTITDYNRIRNNLLYINDVLNERCPDKAQTLDLGDPVVYSSNYYPRQFNAFEDALESFTRAGGNVNIGSKKTFKGNDPFIDSQELNRIERCCLKWYNYDPIIHVSSISISPKSQTIKVGETGTFDVTCLPTNAEEVNSWIASSSNTSVVTVAKNGANVIATGVSEGTATINVSAYKSSDSALINVESIKVTQIIFDKDSIDVGNGDKFNISYQLLPSNATNKDKLKISPSVASIVIDSISENYITASNYMNDGSGYIAFTVEQVSAKVFVKSQRLMAYDIWVSNYYHNQEERITEINYTYATSRINQWWSDGRYKAVTAPAQPNDFNVYLNNYITYTSSNPDIYEVWPHSWKYKIKKRGTCTLTVSLTSGAASYSCTINII